jgi:hypothetical protein
VAITTRATWPSRHVPSWPKDARGAGHAPCKTEGVYSRDMARGNSREGGGMRLVKLLEHEGHGLRERACVRL